MARFPHSTSGGNLAGIGAAKKFFSRPFEIHNLPGKNCLVE
jgi:hypothetical protein